MFKSLIMEETSYTNFIRNIEDFMDRACSSGSSLTVTREDGRDVVILSKSDHDSLQETLHLLSSPKNAQRLLNGLEDYQKGNTTQRDLIE